MRTASVWTWESVVVVVSGTCHLFQQPTRKSDRQQKEERQKNIQRQCTKVRLVCASQPLGREIPLIYIPPVQPSCQWLVSCVRLASHNVRQKQRNKGTTVCSSLEELRDFWSSHWWYARSCRKGHAHQWQHRHKDICIPYMWRSVVAINAFIDAGMHHIFHDIVCCIDGDDRARLHS